MIMLQDQTEKTGRLWANKMKISENSQKFLEQRREVLIKSREDSKKLINESFTNIKDYFAGLEQKKPSAKKEPTKNKKAIQAFKYLINVRQRQGLLTLCL